MARRRKKSDGGELFGGLILIIGVFILSNFQSDNNPAEIAMTLFGSMVAAFIIVLLGFFGFLSFKKNRGKSSNSNQLSNSKFIKAELPKHKAPETAMPWATPSSKAKAIFKSEQVTNLEQTTQWSLEFIQKVEWRTFEKLCMRYFQCLGFEVEDTGGGADGGIDFNLYKHVDGSRKLRAAVQCKSWSKKRVGVAVIRELFGVIHENKTPLAIVMVSGDFSDDAKNFSNSKKLKLINGKKLLGGISKLSEAEQRELLDEITRTDYLTPACPNCDIKLVRRKGSGNKTDFWGCRSFPICRYTLNGL
jgi:restriction system protein